MRSLLSLSALFAGLFGSAWLGSAQEPVPPGHIAEPAEFSTRVAQMAESNTQPMIPKVEIVNIQEKSSSRGRYLWISSMCAVVGASAFDAATSWGKYEGNSLLASSQGRFGAKGIGIKAAIASAGIVPQLMLHRHRDLRTTFTVANFGEAAVFTGVAVHNLGVPAPKE